MSYPIIPLKDVPPPTKRRNSGKWEKFFESIPPNSAMVLPAKIYKSVERCLARYQKQGRFEALKISKRGNKAYVMNEGK